MFLIDVADFAVDSISSLHRFASVSGCWRHAVIDYGRASMWKVVSLAFSRKQLQLCLLQPRAPRVAAEWLNMIITNTGISLDCSEFQSQLPAARAAGVEPETILFSAIYYRNSTVADSLHQLNKAKMFDFEIANLINTLSSSDCIATFQPYGSAVVWDESHHDKLKAISSASSAGAMQRTPFVPYAKVLMPAFYCALIRRSAAITRVALSWTTPPMVRAAIETAPRRETPMLIMALDSVRSLGDADVIEILLKLGGDCAEMWKSDSLTRRTPYEVAKANQVCGEQLVELLKRYDPSLVKKDDDHR